MSAIHPNTAAITDTASPSSASHPLDWRIILQPILCAVTNVLIAVGFGLAVIPVQHDDGRSFIRAITDQILSRSVPINTNTIANERGLQGFHNEIQKTRNDPAVAHVFTRRYCDRNGIEVSELTATEFISRLLGLTAFEHTDDLLAFVYANIDVTVYISAVDHVNTTLSHIRLLRYNDGVNIERVSTHPQRLDVSNIALFVYAGDADIGINCGFLSARPLRLLKRKPRTHVCLHCRESFRSAVHLLRHHRSHYFPCQHLCELFVKGGDCPRPWKSDCSNNTAHNKEVHNNRPRNKKVRVAGKVEAPVIGLSQRRQHQSHMLIQTNTTSVSTISAKGYAIGNTGKNMYAPLQRSLVMPMPSRYHQVLSTAAVDYRNVHERAGGTTSGRQLSGNIMTPVPALLVASNMLTSFHATPLITGQTRNAVSADGDAIIDRIIAESPPPRPVKEAEKGRQQQHSLRSFQLESGSPPPFRTNGADDVESFNLVNDSQIFSFSQPQLPDTP